MGITTNNLESLLWNVDLFVRATSFEQLTLWKAYKHYKNIGWNQQSAWTSLIFDEKRNTHYNISFTFVRIYDKTVCFYHSISACVNWLYVEKFIKEANPKPIFSDPMNFYPKNI